MTDINFIFEQYFSRWGNAPTKKLCLKLFLYMSRLPEQELEMLTLNTIGEVLGRDPVSEEVLCVVTFFVSSKTPILEKKHLFIDDNDNFHEIESEDYIRIYRSGEFNHPETGKTIEDWEKKVVPYFTPTKNFFSLVGKK